MLENKSFKGSLTGISIGAITHAGTVTPAQKLWRSLQALGAIAFAYSYSIILIEIQVRRLSRKSPIIQLNEFFLEAD